MFGLSTGHKATDGVKFCDGCAEVTTAAQRARRHLEATRDSAISRRLIH